MTYEYDFVTLELTEQQKHIIQVGFAQVDQLNVMWRNIINDRAADGWEPLYPFSVPDIWFRRIKKKKTKKS